MLGDTVGLALLVVLERLGPVERLAFVLHDLFGLPFDEIAPIVERYPAATRQLASRARRRVRGAVARIFCGRASAAQPVLVDGVLDVAYAPGGRPRSVFRLVLEGERIAAIAVVADPAGLDALDVVLLER